MPLYSEGALHRGLFCVINLGSSLGGLFSKSYSILILNPSARFPKLYTLVASSKFGNLIFYQLNFMCFLAQYVWQCLLEKNSCRNLFLSFILVRGFKILAFRTGASLHMPTLRNKDVSFSFAY